MDGVQRGSHRGLDRFLGKGPTCLPFQLWELPRTRRLGGAGSRRAGWPACALVCQRLSAKLLPPCSEPWIVLSKLGDGSAEEPISDS